MEQERTTFNLEYRKSVVACGVKDVLSFNDKEIKVALFDGGKGFITGEEMKIVGFNKQSGELKAVGVVSGIKFSSSARAFFKKLVK